MKKSNWLISVLCLGVVFLSCEVNNFKQGKNLYAMHCQSCHSEDGSGLRDLIPPLANADYLVKYKDEIACLIRNGIKGTIVVNEKTYDTEMAGIPTLTDIQINNIINYINHEWGNDVGLSNVKEVEKSLENCL